MMNNTRTIKGFTLAARSPVGNLGDNFVNSDEGLISWIASHSFAMTHTLLYAYI